MRRQSRALARSQHARTRSTRAREHAARASTQRQAQQQCWLRFYYSERSFVSGGDHVRQTSLVLGEKLGRGALRVKALPKSSVPSPTPPSYFYDVASNKKKSALGRSFEAVGLPASAASQSWSTLSGGQSQRAYMCVMLSLRPEVVLLDEATSACDPDATLAVERLVRECGAAAVWVTHSREQAVRLAGVDVAFAVECADEAHATA